MIKIKRVMFGSLAIMQIFFCGNLLAKSDFDYSHSSHVYDIRSNSSKHTDQWCRDKFNKTTYHKFNQRGEPIASSIGFATAKIMVTRKIQKGEYLTLVTNKLGSGAVLCKDKMHECKGVFYTKNCHGRFNLNKLSKRNFTSH